MKKPRERGFFHSGSRLAICCPTRLSFAANTLPLPPEPTCERGMHTGKRLDTA
jgi:hypothetical protein